MPIPTDNSLGLIPSSITSFFGNSLKSPFWLALLITVSIILIIIFVYPAKKSSSIGKLLKLMIYLFVVILVFLMLHDNALHEVWKIENEDKSARDMIGGMGDFINGGHNLSTMPHMAQPAQPRFNNTVDLLGQPININPI